MQVALKLLNSGQSVVATATFDFPSSPSKRKKKVGLAAIAIYHWLGALNDDNPPKGRVILSISEGDDQLDVSMDITTALATFGCGSEVLSTIDEVDSFVQGDYETKSQVVA